MRIVASGTAMGLMLVGSLVALGALLAVSVLLANGRPLHSSSPSPPDGGWSGLPAPPPAPPRDPWTPLDAGLRHLARTRHGRVARELARVYGDRAFRPFWVTPRSLSEDGRSLIARLSGSVGNGFRSDDEELTEIAHLYQRAFADQLHPEAHRLAELEWELSAAFLSQAERLMEGQAPWARVRARWFLPERIPKAALFFRKLEERGARRTMKALARSHERYTSLGRALAEYRSIQRAGGWSPVPEGDVLARGDRGDRVRSLRHRLEVTGDLEGAASSDLYDPEVERAVQRFQERHGLTVDGRVGGATLQALNVPVEARIHQLELNLERRRWLPSDLGDEFVWVNIPEFRLRAYREGREVLSMPVVVGAPGSPTPTFHEEIDHAVVNPYWYVPERIAVTELLPKADLDPRYLRRADFEILDERGEMLPSDELKIAALRSGRQRIRRRPGPSNDLGRIKFMFPNPFRVYLHDTPATHLFDRPSRAFSHGCVRVGRPLDLARFLFHDRYPQIESELDSGEPRVMSLEKPVPVYLVYFTAWRDPDGRVHFRDDVYGRDQELEVELSNEWHSRRSDPATRMLWPPMAPMASVVSLD